jgi:zinc protease
METVMSRNRQFQATNAPRWSSFVPILSLALLAFCCAPEAVGQEPGAPLPSGVERVATVEGITEYRLANGLRVLLFPDPSRQTITVNITYLVGSRHEGYGETGMAHLLEHLVFKGSPRHPNIPQELTEHGARPNGTTWFDRTNYFETFPATEANLEWALDLEADRMVNSFIAQKDLDSEMTVVRNEFERGENDPVGVLLERTHATAYLWHNYGKSTIGARSDIEKVPIERLRAFYRTYYQPDNAVLLVAGRFDPAKTLGLVQAKFGAIPRPARTLPQTYTAEPTQDGERSVMLRRVGEVQAICAAYHIPAGSHPDYAAVDVLSRILGDAPSGRLHKALVQTRKATSVSASGYQLREPGLLTFQAQVRGGGSLEATRDTLLKTVEEMATAPPTAAEVDRAKAQILRQIELDLRSSDRIGLEISEWAAMGDWRLLFLNRDRVRAVTAADVQRVAASYLKPANRTVGLFIPTRTPDRAEIPPVPDVAAMVRDYKGSAEIALGEAFDPTPANIEARVVRRDLPGGLKLALLPKKTRGGTVRAQMTLRFGDEKSLRNQTSISLLTAQMLMRGTKKRTRQQIQDELDRLQARLMVGGSGRFAASSPDAVQASIEATRENLAPVMTLLAEILREPAFPTEEFAQLKQARLAGIEEQKGEPARVASNALARHLRPYPKGDPRYVPTPDEQIAEIQAARVEDARRFHADFYGASHGELAVLGDFDPDEVAGLAEKLFGGWKSRRPYRRIPSLYHEVSPAEQTVATPDKANAVFLAEIPLKLRDDDPDYPALALGSYMLGGGFLNSRLASRIRQKEGISYGVSARLSADALDRVGSFSANAIYAPENVNRLEAAFREEIDRALRDGFSAEEVAAAKSGYLQSRQLNRAQDAMLARQLASYRFTNRTYAWDTEFEAKVQALTPAQIATALRKHLDPAKFSIVKAGDFPDSAASRR